MSLLTVSDLKAYYNTKRGGVKAVDGVSFMIRKDETFGIAGESGCGKTTLAKAILGVLKPPGFIYGGKVFFDGIDLLSLKDSEFRRIRGKRLSYIPQSSMNALNPVMRVEDQIVDAMMTHEKISKDEAKGRAEEVLKMVGLPARCTRMYPHELSGGMRQRVVIAISVALNPDLVFADEPTTALDVVVQRSVLQSLAEVRKRLGASMILITHDIAVHAEVADKLAIMYAGKMVEVAGINEISEESLHPYTQALMSAVPSIKRRKKLEALTGYPPDLINPPSGCRFNPRCKSATERCRNEEPTLSELKSEHWVACHLYKS